VIGKTVIGLLLLRNKGEKSLDLQTIKEVELA
jgi:hypothetical protein